MHATLRRSPLPTFPRLSGLVPVPRQIVPDPARHLVATDLAPECFRRGGGVAPQGRSGHEYSGSMPIGTRGQADRGNRGPSRPAKSRDLTLCAWLAELDPRGLPVINEDPR